jgi:hypothetical protein
LILAPWRLVEPHIPSTSASGASTRLACHRRQRLLERVSLVQVKAFGWPVVKGDVAAGAVLARDDARGAG